MKVLVVKTSSMGDVIHTLPALTDAAEAIPGIVFDWVVEEAFSEIPVWHPSVRRVIPVAIRRWRKAPLTALRSGEWGRYRKALAAETYDAVIDAQGLLKSTLLATRLARGKRCGMDRASAREPAAALFYDRGIAVPKGMHAVDRTRRLFAGALGYAMPERRGRYGIEVPPRATADTPPYLVFLHGTTRHEKHWPEVYWTELIALAVAEGYAIKLVWGNAVEQARAERLASTNSMVEVLPRSSLTTIAQVLSQAAGIVSVDTGLSHLAAALGRPNVVLFGPTDPGLVGGYGDRQICLKAREFPASGRSVDPAVFAPLTPEIVLATLDRLLNEGEAR